MYMYMYIYIYIYIYKEPGPAQEASAGLKGPAAGPAAVRSRL